jgi:hypothetical protein
MAKIEAYRNGKTLSNQLYFIKMENAKQKEDLLNKYSGKTFAPLQPPVAQNEPTEKTEYEGIIEGKAGRNNRFKIVDINGDSYGFGYAYLIGWVFTPPSMLTINTSTHICTIEGRGLEAIERALIDEKVRELRAYNPKTHTLTGEEKAVIERLEIINRFEPNS